MDFSTLKLQRLTLVIKYRPSAKRWRAENRDTHILGLHRTGFALHTFSDKSFMLAPNCIYFFNRRDAYDVEVREPGESLSVHFTTYEPIATESFCLPLQNCAAVAALLERLERLVNGSGQPDSHEAASCFYAVCAAFERARQKPYTAGQQRIQAAQKYLRLHCTEEDCLERAAAVCGVSRRRFGDLFFAVCQMTPNQYRTLCKTERAKALLPIDGLAIADVAEQCGFRDPYYFSKVFKQETGLTPSAYRSKNRLGK